jgi:prevent-host-death family protein
MVMGGAMGKVKPGVVRETLALPLPAEIGAGRFKAVCLELMDRVRETGAEVVITKYGVPVARLVPMAKASVGIVGCMRGTGRIVGDIVSPVEYPESADAHNLAF